jgi:creatinine amidohydrolase
VNAIKILQKKKPELHFILHPIIPLGYCKFNIDFPGSISISPKTIREIIFGVGSSLARHNFHNLLICTFHMAIGHLKGIHQGMQKLRRKYDLRISEPWSTFFYSNQIEKREPKLGFDTSKELHAGFRETSLMKYQYPYLVDESHKKLQNIYRDLRSPSVLGKKFKELGLTEGYVGSPARSDADYGRWYYNETVTVLVNAAIDLYEGNPLPVLPPSIRILMRSPIW